MQIPKPSEQDKAFFLSILPHEPGVEVKPMFGNLGAFVNRNMFAGLFGPIIGVRLSGTDSIELRSVDGAGPFGPAERPMAGYTGLPEAWSNTREQAAEWVARAYAHVSALPPKPIKTAKSSAPRRTVDPPLQSEQAETL